jgi:hypothetical protein
MTMVMVTTMTINGMPSKSSRPKRCSCAFTKVQLHPALFLARVLTEEGESSWIPDLGLPEFIGFYSFSRP